MKKNSAYLKCVLMQEQNKVFIKISNYTFITQRFEELKLFRIDGIFRYYIPFMLSQFLFYFQQIQQSHKKGNGNIPCPPPLPFFDPKIILQKTYLLGFLNLQYLICICTSYFGIRNILGLSDLCLGVEKKIVKKINAFLLYDLYGHALAREPLPRGS